MTARDDRLRELAQEATPGPWLHDEAGYRAPDWPEDMHYRRVVRGEPHPVSGWRECVVSTHGAVDETAGARRNEVTAAYIAAASPDVVLGLLDRLAAVEAERDRLAAAVERVEALADEWVEDYPGPTAACNRTPNEWGADLRAALSDAGSGGDE